MKKCQTTIATVMIDYEIIKEEGNDVTVARFCRGEKLPSWTWNRNTGWTGSNKGHAGYLAAVRLGLMGGI